MTPTDDQIDCMSLEELLDLLPTLAGSLPSAVPLATPTGDNQKTTLAIRIAEGRSEFTSATTPSQAHKAFTRCADMVASKSEPCLWDNVRGEGGAVLVVAWLRWVRDQPNFNIWRGGEILLEGKAGFYFKHLVAL